MSRGCKRCNRLTSNEYLCDSCENELRGRQLEYKEMNRLNVFEGTLNHYVQERSAIKTFHKKFQDEVNRKSWVDNLDKILHCQLCFMFGMIVYIIVVWMLYN